MTDSWLSHKIPDPTDMDTPWSIQERDRLAKLALKKNEESHDVPLPPQNEEPVVTTLLKDQIRMWRDLVFYTGVELEEGASDTVFNPSNCVHVVAQNSSDNWTARFYFDNQNGVLKCVVWAY